MPTNPIDAIFSKAVEAGASDIHIAADAYILFRINGILTAQTDRPVTGEQSEQFIKAVLGAENYKRFEKDREIDVSYSLKDGTRLRVNCAFERGFPTLVARVIATRIPTLEELNLQEIYGHIQHMKEGLILFTGTTGSGKSTSLASIINNIQQERPVNLITLEDPIEYLFSVPQGNVVRQRQFSHDFNSFAEGLKRVLRQDPDVVMVGEMRDPETIAAALTLAETGHLIFGTLHTPNTIQTVDRIIDVFPAYQQPQVRSQLSMSLKAVVAQRLIAKEGGGRIALREVLVNTPAVSNIIRENRAQELRSVLQTNEDIGMCPFEKSLKKLYKEGKISKETYDYVLVTL